MNQTQFYAPRRSIQTRGTALLVLLLLLLLLSSTTVTLAETQIRGPIISSDVLEILKSQGSASVIINVATTGNLTNTAVFAGEIAAARDNVLAALPAESFSLTSSYQTIPAFAGTLTLRGLSALQNHPLVTVINLNKRVSITQTLPTAAPRYDDEAKLLHRADQLNTAGYTGEGSRVGIIDTGIDNQHPSTALLEDLFFQRCFLPACTGGAESGEDENSHGTHVAGIITGEHGVAPAAEFAALKVFDESGTTTDEIILSALDYAANNDATLELDAINMSLGGGLYPSTEICESENAAYVTAIASLNSLDIAVFVATGNDYATEGVSSPGCVTGAIGVGSVDDAAGVWDERSAPDVVSSFSNGSPLQGDGEMVDILAPGCAILSEIPPDLNNGTTTGSYCGTSMATPTAAGIFAALLQFKPMNPAEAESLLEASGDSVVDDRSGMNNQIFPRIDAMNAYGALILETPTNLTATVAGTAVNLAWTDVSGETGYVVEYQSGNSGTWKELGTTAADVVAFTDDSPACGLVSYRVKSTDGTAQSLPSNVATVTAVACPLAPTGLTASLTATTVELVWVDNATDETVYLVERDLGTGFVEIGDSAANSTAYSDTTPTCGLNHYRVRAYRAGDTNYSDYSNVAEVVRCPPTNDEFSNAESITVTPFVDLEPEFLYASMSTTDPAFSCRVGGADKGGIGIWYTFTTSTGGTVDVSTEGSTPIEQQPLADTLLAIFTGTEEALTEIACNDDISIGNYVSKLDDVPVTAETTYYIFVANWDTSLIGNVDDLKLTFSTTAELADNTPEATELLVNGSFETDADGDKQPDDWKGKNLKGDKMRCNTETKTFAHDGTCAYQFKGVNGEKSTVSQKPDAAILKAGDTLDLSVWIKTKVASVGKVVVMKITYADDTSETLSLTMSAAATEYTQMTDSLTLPKDVSNIKVRVGYKKAKGKIFVDALSLLHTPGSTGEKHQDGILPLIPLPQAQSGMGNRSDKQAEIRSRNTGTGAGN